MSQPHVFRRRAPRGLSVLPGLLLATASQTVWAEAPADDEAAHVEQLPAVVVSGGVPQTEARTAAAVGVVDARMLKSGRPQINLAETLNSIPGVDVRDRQNSAQDLQIQIRGYGARSTFGVRGIQLRADGVPLTAPDGQGAVSNLLIGSLDRIEVLRGPLAYQYGNSAGGVIAAYSLAPPDRLGTELSFSAGDNGSWREALAIGGRAADQKLGYRLDLERYDIAGYRDHSKAQRNVGALNARYDLGNGQQLRLLAGALWGGDAEDPLGLTRQQFEQDPRQVAAVAKTYNTRKNTDDWRAALGWSGAWSKAADWDLIVYGSGRRIEQFLSIPKAAQASPARAGGVVDLDRNGAGVDARSSWQLGELRLSAGLQYQLADEHRRGYENFVGDALGVRGALRRDEDNRLYNFDQFLFAEYAFLPRWRLSAAVRHSRVAFKSEDDYIRAGNPDDSGSTDFSATLPTIGLAFEQAEGRLFYLSAGIGFETPTFNELSYRSDGEGGLNLALDASTSRSVEIGVKQQFGNHGLLTLALFKIDSDDEIVAGATVDGRASFQNADTARHGAELGLVLRLPAALRLQMAASYLDATFAEQYRYNNGSTTVTVNDGNPIPGVAQGSVYGELSWRRGQPGWAATLEARYSDKVSVNDIASDAAPSYTVVNASAAYRALIGRWDVEGFVRVYNLLDRRYIGSVIVNDANGRYFEPAPDRGVHAGLSLRWGS
jgi:iron complex outermembrane receptor protein